MAFQLIKKIHLSGRQQVAGLDFDLLCMGHQRTWIILSSRDPQTKTPASTEVRAGVF